MEKFLLIIFGLIFFICSCSGQHEEKWDTNIPESEDFNAENAFWNKDGSRIYFQHDDFTDPENLGADDIWVYDFDTKQRSKVFNGRAYEADIDSKEQKFIYHKPGLTLYIYEYDLRNKLERRLTGTQETNTFENTLLARFSPDDSKILFTILAGEPRGVAVMDTNGTNAEIIVDYAIMGGWFPDGNKIIYVNWLEGNTGKNAKQIFEASADGSNQKVLTDLPDTRLLAGPVVSPNGKTIAFGNDGGEGHSELFLMDYQTGKIEQVTKGIGYAEAFAWSPDGTRIAFERVIPNVSKYLYLFDVNTYEVEPLFNEK